MRLIFLPVFLLGFGIGAVHAADDPNIPPVLPDPKPNNAIFPPASATAGAADPGPALNAISGDMVDARAKGCSAANPCAVDSPPADHLMPISSAPDAALADWKRRMQAAKPATH